jgi:hypothetical protein
MAVSFYAKKKKNIAVSSEFPHPVQHTTIIINERHPLVFSISTSSSLNDT